MIAFFKLIRWKNLLIIIATMIIMRNFVLIPVYDYFEAVRFFSDTGFIYLILATVFIAAGGNIINDYFDRKADYINKPEKVIVGFKLKRRTAILLHIFFSAIGLFFGFIASYHAGSFYYGFFFLLIVFILWKYSTLIKKKVVWDNFVVAALTALVPAIVGLSEFFAAHNALSELNLMQYEALKTANSMILGFAVFAFIYNFIREIVKDAEDVKGDRKVGVKTIPIVFGKKLCNYVLSVLFIISALGVVIIFHSFMNKVQIVENKLLINLYVWVLILIPSIFLAIKVLFAETKEHYTYISKIIKYIIVFGVSFSLMISIVINGNF